MYMPGNFGVRTEIEGRMKVQKAVQIKIKVLLFLRRNSRVSPKSSSLQIKAELQEIYDVII